MMKCQLSNKCEYGDMCKPNYEIGGCSHFKPKRKKTNFQRITASPEALAEFLADTINDIISGVLAFSDDGGAYVEDEFWQRKDDWVDWLKQESE